MDWIYLWISRFLALFQRRRLEDDLDQELHAHLEFAVEDYLARGMSPETARTAALRDFGGVTQTKERYRVQRGIPLFEQICRDLKFGIRQLQRSPGFTFTAVLTLALGLGANAAIFSIINGLLLRPLSVPHPEELSIVHYLPTHGVRDVRIDGSRNDHSFSVPLLRALENRHDVFQDVAGFHNDKWQVSEVGRVIDVPGCVVSGHFFLALETPPLLGRYLLPRDDQPRGASSGFSVVVSQAFWEHWFHGASNVVGRSLIISNAAFTVVGVMPKSFIGADPTFHPDLYVPVSAEPAIDAPFSFVNGGYKAWWLRVIARRRPGVSAKEANIALKVASPSILASAVPDAKWNKNAGEHRFTFAAESGSTGYSDLRVTFTKPLIVVLSLCGAMLLLACLNLASMSMARSVARQHEMTTRVAIGATRGRLMQQLMVESLLIAALGAATCLLVAPFTTRALTLVLIARTQGRVLDTSLDGHAFLFIGLVGMLAAVLIGLLPALRITNTSSLNEHIKAAPYASSSLQNRRLLPRMLMGFQVALALGLVIGSGLLSTSLARLYQTDLGFEPSGIVNIDLDMSKQSRDGPALVRWYRQYMEELRRQPGVMSVSLTSIVPLSGTLWIGNYHTSISSGDHAIYMNAISKNYFESMRIPILYGHDFSWDDTPTTVRKIILSQRAAESLFPARNPIGQFVIGEDQPAYQVVAVVGDTRNLAVRAEASAGVYVPVTQSREKKPSYTVVVRIHTSAAASLARAAKTIATRMSPEIPVPETITMIEELNASISSERMMAILSGFFATPALLVTAIGLYGTLAYATARRTREIGIRMALGARRRQILDMVFLENASVIGSGLCIGLVIALATSRVLSSFVYGISTNDPYVLAGSAALLVLVASLASVLPSIRAAQVDSTVALRQQ